MFGVSDSDIKLVVKKTCTSRLLELIVVPSVYAEVLGGNYAYLNCVATCYLQYRTPYFNCACMYIYFIIRSSPNCAATYIIQYTYLNYDANYNMHLSTVLSPTVYYCLLFSTTIIHLISWFPPASGRFLCWQYTKMYCTVMCEYTVFILYQCIYIYFTL